MKEYYTQGGFSCIVISYPIIGKIVHAIRLGELLLWSGVFENGVNGGMTQGQERNGRIIRITGHRKTILGSVIVLLFSLVLLHLLGGTYRQRLLAERRAQVAAELAPYGTALGILLEQRLSLLDAINAFIRSHPNPESEDMRAGFLTFARNLFPQKKGLRALQFYPRSGAVFLYPTEGNEVVRDRTLQHIMTDPRPNVYEDVRRTVDTRRTSLSDPYEMLRGGLGIVARQALFLNEALFGIGVVVMDIPPLLREAGLDSPLRNIDIALCDRTGRIFSGREGIFAESPATCAIPLVEGAWSMAAVPSGGWERSISRSMLFFRAAGAAFAVLLSVLFYLSSLRRNAMMQLVTERTAELDDSRRRYRTLFDGNSDFLFVVAPDGGILDTNRAAEKEYGYSAEEFRNLTVIDITPPDLRDMVRERLLAASLGEVQFESRHRKKDGSELPVEAHSCAVSLDGKPCLLSTIRDISERKRSEARTYWLSSILERSLNEIYAFDTETLRFTYANRGALDNLGYTLEELRTRTPVDIKPLFTQDSFRELLAPIAAGTIERLSFETTHRRKDGTCYHALIALQIAKDEAGKQFVAIGLDITGRKKAEADLARAMERLRGLHEIDRAILEARPTDEIVEIALRRIRTLLPCDDATFTAAETDSERGGTKETRFVDDIDEAIREDPYLAPLRDRGIRSFFSIPAAAPDGIFGVLNVDFARPAAFSAEDAELGQEIASQLAIAFTNTRLLDEVRANAANLEKLVEERTASLEAANGELESFCYSVSHDLRAPLRAIGGYAGILSEEYAPSLDDEGKRVCSVILANTTRMGALIDGLLAFSRFGRAKMSPSPLDMEDLVRSIYDEITPEDTRGRIDFRLSPLPSATGDVTLIRQVWSNLLSNAIKFTSKRERPHIEIEGTTTETELVYTIRDNGSGFDMQFADRLFGVFQRLHSMQEFDGTGVGLAIVRRIVERHGGRIRAEGRVDRGAEFVFTLPRYANENENRSERRA